MNNHYYNKNLKKHATKLRTKSVSRAEKHIWKAVLKKRQRGVLFKRQRPLDYFIVDFLSQEIKLIIEIDGSSHFHKSSYDRYRQDKLETLGYTILRFSEKDVLKNIDDIKSKIDHTIHVLRTETPYNISSHKKENICEPKPQYRRGFGLITR